MKAHPITLVGCCGEKLSRIAPARELYRSPMFRKAAIYADQLGHEWHVISARFGLIRCADQLAPYDFTMESMSALERTAWQYQVAAQLEAIAAYHDAEALDVTFLDGEKYLSWLPLVASWCAVRQPMRGLQVGQRLQWLNNQQQRPELALVG